MLKRDVHIFYQQTRHSTRKCSSKVKCSERNPSKNESKSRIKSKRYLSHFRNRVIVFALIRTLRMNSVWNCQVNYKLTLLKRSRRVIWKISNRVNKKEAAASTHNSIIKSRGQSMKTRSSITYRKTYSKWKVAATPIKKLIKSRCPPPSTCRRWSTLFPWRRRDLLWRILSGKKEARRKG